MQSPETIARHSYWHVAGACSPLGNYRRRRRDHGEVGRYRFPAHRAGLSGHLVAAQSFHRSRQFTDRFCRLWHRGAGIQVGRLQGPRREGQGSRDSCRRSADSRPSRLHPARSQNVSRAGAFVLRTCGFESGYRVRSRRVGGNHAARRRSRGGPRGSTRRRRRRTQPLHRARNHGRS